MCWISAGVGHFFTVEGGLGNAFVFALRSLVTTTRNYNVENGTCRSADSGTGTN